MESTFRLDCNNLYARTCASIYMNVSVDTMYVGMAQVPASHNTFSKPLNTQTKE